ncbi:MAG: hypothetical protein CVU50_00410 [Candidatus Cloacimonetes bacterium HGW-Cloacimonetes-3]|nr:MAG: hypothetical protein CVU50_00410 [Candidatus Cloacimonetes bacterium HGW-Cloacimonetes-3]
MKICVYYFSGTGNTRFVAEDMQQRFIDSGSQCELIPIESVTKGEVVLNPEEYDLVGIGFPVHAYDAPGIVYEFLELLPAAPIRYFLFKTAGDKLFYGGSTNHLRMLLANKRWKLAYESFFVMPANMASPAKPGKIARLAEAARIHSAETVADILSGTRKLLPDSTSQRISTLFKRLETRGCRKGSRHWRVSSNCDLCGKCVQECPTSNITLVDGKLKFGDKCIFCLRCWWNCPSRAIDHPYAHAVLLKKPYILPT